MFIKMGERNRKEKLLLKGIDFIILFAVREIYGSLKVHCLHQKWKKWTVWKYNCILWNSTVLPPFKTAKHIHYF